MLFKKTLLNFIINGSKKKPDTVFHEILLNKLYHHSVGGPAYNLIESCLSNRNQFVSINNHCSLSIPINIGVSQESILGPLLFLVYVNDIYMLQLVIFGFLLMIHASYQVTPPSQILKKIVI